MYLLTFLLLPTLLPHLESVVHYNSVETCASLDRKGAQTWGTVGIEIDPNVSNSHELGKITQKDYYQKWGECEMLA